MDLLQKAPQPRPLWTTEDVAGYLAVPVKTLYKAAGEARAFINAATGELLRELTLDPTRNYQPLGRPPGPKPKTRKPDPHPGSGLSRDLLVLAGLP